MSEPPDPPDGFDPSNVDWAAINQRVVEQAFEFWINPEIEKRRADGSLGDDFELRAAQVIFEPDAPPYARLNDEARAIMNVRAARDIEKGELITHGDIHGIESVRLTDADPNAGHITLILRPGGWHVSFDFRYNAERIAEHQQTARQFLDTARSALERNAFAAFVENLWAAVELMAKGMMLSTPDDGLMKSKKHTYVSSRFNMGRKMGHVDPRHTELLNKLTRERESARYAAGELDLTADEARERLAIAEEMYEVVERERPRTISTDEPSTDEAE
jgi:uncharacterized protein (UPF0332 family)